MPVRSTMANLIARVRILINDTLPLGSGQIFTDQHVQDVLDEGRENIRYVSLAPSPTYSGSNISYLDYYADYGNFEDDVTLWQYRINAVTPATSENIVGHWTFTLTTLPPVFALGKRFDPYKASADLLEERSALWMMSYDGTVDGQSLHRSQVAIAMQKLAHTYRLRQRPIILGSIRSDIGAGDEGGPSLSPTEIDYIGQG